MEIEKYEDVPVYRKSWFVLLSYFIFPPATVAILMTGGAFAKDKKNEGGTKKWGKANTIVAWVLCIGWLVNIGGYFVTSPEDMTTEVSGIWRDVSDGTMVKIDLISSNKSLEINGNAIPVKISGVDTDNKIISLQITSNGQNAIWTLRQNYDEGNKSFTLTMTLHDGTQGNLAFVRNL